MKQINSIIEKIGKAASWINIVLIVLIISDVFLRYMFNNTKNWVLELEWHLFAIIFLIGSSYALQKDEHVRVDLFYQNYSEKTKAWVNAIGHVLFLIPWASVIIYTGYHFALNSYSFNEGSPNPGGLPYRYIIKSIIALSFVLLVLQAISQMVQSFKIIRKK